LVFLGIRELEIHFEQEAAEDAEGDTKDRHKTDPQISQIPPMRTSEATARMNDS
jgi:hypothetical protein